MFVCHVTPLLRNVAKDLPVAVYWTFVGRRLDIDPQIESEGHYVSKSSENRHALLITKARPEDEGEYACVVSAGDKIDTASRRLIVQRKYLSSQSSSFSLFLHHRNCYTTSKQKLQQYNNNNNNNCLGRLFCMSCSEACRAIFCWTTSLTTATNTYISKSSLLAVSVFISFP